MCGVYGDCVIYIGLDMELKKLHMGTMSYSLDTMDEIMSHLASAFEDQEPGRLCKQTCIV